MATGQADYYLDQAQARVNRATSVSSGAEDYYLGGAEAPGVWLGEAARDLGLRGQVCGDDLRAVLAGEDPVSGAPLKRMAARVPGFDVTFSAPKSVSILFGVGDADTQAIVREAHQRAVDAAFDYIEQAVSVARRGAGGARAIAGDGLAAGAFLHRISRAGDPQLHTHVVTANLGRGPDGRWSALDGRRLYAHARTASFVYQAVLRAELTRAVGVG
jgi:conjugative relaxase-like TrwC/TraI family protein